MALLLTKYGFPNDVFPWHSYKLLTCLSPDITARHLNWDVLRYFPDLAELFSRAS
jgi:hypothetical protein